MFEPTSPLVDPLGDDWHDLVDGWVREWAAQSEREAFPAAEAADPPAEAGGPPTAVELDGFVASVLEVGPGVWAAAALASVDPSQLSEVGRLDLLAAWQAQSAWTDAMAASALVAHVGRQPMGAASLPAVTDADLPRLMRLSEASVVLRTSESTMRGRFEVARDLESRLPRTRQALVDGSITWAHVRVVSEGVAPLSDGDAATVDAMVMRDPHAVTLATLRRRLRRSVAQVDADAAARRVRQAHAGRRLERHGTPDGLAGLTVWSDARDIQAMWLALTRLAGPRDADDPRPVGARRVDALLGLCLAATSPSGDVAADAEVGAGPPDRPRPPVEVQVVVDLPTLAGLADHPGELGGYGPVPAGAVRDWLADATTWRRLVTDEVTGHLLDYGPRVRFAPTRLTAYLAARDRTCTFPGCPQPATRCDCDHHPPWKPGGSGGHTSAAHMAQLCRRHHRWKTHHGWRLERLADGTSRWTSPSGRRYDVLRRPVLEDP